MFIHRVKLYNQTPSVWEIAPHFAGFNHCYIVKGGNRLNSQIIQAVINHLLKNDINISLIKTTF